MQYRDHEFRYDAEQLFDMESEVRQEANGKQYVQKRSVRPKRRRNRAKAWFGSPGAET